MSVASISRIRNAGVVGHGGTGKTSLIERILHTAGAIGRVGTIKEGNTVGDYLDEERDHQHTITTEWHLPFRLSGSTDILLSHSNGTDSITLSGYYSNDPFKVDRIVFADGTVWDQTTLEAMANGGGA